MAFEERPKTAALLARLGVDTGLGETPYRRARERRSGRCRETVAPRVSWIVRSEDCDRHEFRTTD
jgi:hypothetical protein